MEVKDALDPETIRAMQALVAAGTALDAQADVPEALSNPFVVSRGQYEGTTEINGVAVDMRSEGLFATACADCSTPLDVEIAPKGVDLDLLTSKPRIAVCEPCGKARVQGKRGVVVHHAPRVARHQPRVTDGIDHPVEVKHTEKEQVMDLNNYSPAQLADLVARAQDALRAKAAAALPARVAAAVADETKREAADQEVKVEQREAHKGWVLDGFTLHGVEVPTLDLSGVTDLNEEVTAKVRSPYNKALYRNGEPLLTAKVEPGDAEHKPTTWAILVKVHERLAVNGTLATLDGTEQAALKVVTGLDDAQVADLGGLPKAEPQIIAVIDPRVAALMQVRPDLTELRAQEIVASL